MFFLATQKTMEPNIYKGDTLATRQIKDATQIKRGDVVYYHDNISSECCVKRILCLPRENIKVENGKIIINDRHFQGIPEIKRDFFSNMPLYRIDPGRYFLMGDDMNASMKSLKGISYLDTVPFENLIGKVIAIYWPPKHAKYLV